MPFLLSLSLAVLSTFAHAARPIPANTDHTRALFVVYNASNSSLIEDYAKLLARQNVGVSDPTRLVIFHNESDANKVAAFLGPKPAPYVSTVKKSDDEISELGGTEDWYQDTGEFYYSPKGETMFLNHKEMVRSTILTGYLKDELKVGITELTDKRELTDMDSIEGGNIEATPGGTVYVGDNLSPAYMQALEKIVGKDKVLKLSTDATNVGHVDESYQFIPANTSCGYALAYSDHLDGLRLKLAFNLVNSPDLDRDEGERPVATKEYLDAITHFTGVKAADIKLDLSSFHALAAKFDARKRPRPFNGFYGFRKEDLQVYKAFTATKEVLEGLKLLKERVAKEGCKDLKVIPMPTLWAYGFNDQVEPGLTADEMVQYRISTLTAFTNMVVINGALVIPDAKAPSQLLNFYSNEDFARIGAKFKEIVTARLTAVGIKNEDIIFTDVSGAILGDGAAHCKTNILRVPRN